MTFESFCLYQVCIAYLMRKHYWKPQITIPPKDIQTFQLGKPQKIQSSQQWNRIIDTIQQYHPML